MVIYWSTFPAYLTTNEGGLNLVSYLRFQMEVTAHVVSSRPGAEGGVGRASTDYRSFRMLMLQRLQVMLETDWCA